MDIIKAIVAGLFFGAWPLFMSRSNLAGHVSAAAFSLICLVCVMPFAWYQLYHQGITGLAQANYLMVGLAGLTGSIGMLVFTNMMANVAPAQIGVLLLMTSLAQTVMPAVTHVFLNGWESVTLSKGLGFVLAIAAMWLLR